MQQDGAPKAAGKGAGKLKRKEYERELARLHIELVKMQYWIKAAGKRLVARLRGP